MHKKLLVTGSEGQLAKSFLKLFSDNEVVGVSKMIVND